MKFSRIRLPSLILVQGVVALLLLDVTRGEAPPMTDYDFWKTDSGEKTRHPAPCSVCDEMFHDDELADGLCSKCEKEGEE